MSIEIGGYILELDKEATEKVYKKIRLGGSQECSCDYCKNYIEAIDSIFPEEITIFFDVAGIDKNKDAEVYELCEESPGIHHYGGEYYLLAKVIEHPKTPPKLGEYFNYSFIEPSPLVQEEFEVEGAVCFTFDTMVPWKLNV
ncbi:hypothetical protein DZA50_06100 [Kangiella sp. HD9-110m-PIT-SAG07]|nr:hypothetical protein DZA50_06100 [Kangiella sp. HD9-110m-PIT-SAG07]